MNLYDLLELSEIKAIESAIDPTPESIWRMRCRAYSQKYFTPLHVVMNELDPNMVFQALYEDIYSPSIVNEELEELIEKLYKIKDPSYSRMSKEDTEAMVDNIMNYEIARMAKKKAPTQESISTEIKTAEAQKPKSGSMDFSQLENLESKSEQGKSGFED